MSKIAIMTDTNSGITQKHAQQLGVFLLPMPFVISDQLFYEEVNLTHDEFYAKLAANEDVSTSQPSPGSVGEMWEDILTHGYDEIVYIPMSSGLSTSCQSALVLAEFAEGRVQVVNNQRIAVTQKQSVLDALVLRDQGLTAVQIKERLEQNALDASIYISVDTLHYLKKGGRVTPAAAAIGTVLNIKPVLTIQGEKLDAFAKVRGMKAGRKAMLDALQKDLSTRFADLHREGRLAFFIAWSQADEAVVSGWRQEVQAAFPGEEILSDPLTLSIGCHIGPGGLGVAVCVKEPTNDPRYRFQFP